MDARDKGLKLVETDAQGTALASNTSGADINIATARGEIATGMAAQGDIAIASVVGQRAKTNGRIVVADCVVKKRASATPRR